MIALAPTLSAMAPIAEPLDTDVKLPVLPLRHPTVAAECATIGVTFACVLAFTTVAV